MSGLMSARRGGLICLVVNLDGVGFYMRWVDRVRLDMRRAKVQVEHPVDSLLPGLPRL